MAGSFIKKKILKSGEVRYTATITYKSRNYKTKTFRRRRDAADWAARFLSDLENFAITGKKPCEVTFSDLANEYLKHWTGTDSIRISAVQLFAEYFGDKLLDSITTEDCRDALQKWDNKAPATFNKYKAILASIFDYAILRNEETEKSYISTNPVKTVRNKPIDNQRVRYLSDDEKKRLVIASREVGGKFYLAFVLALCTGLRKSNVLERRWSDVDFSRGLLEVRKTKNGDPVYSPLPAPVLDVLAEYREVGNGLIFPSTTDPDKPFDFKKQWNRARKLAQIDDFRWHDLRHDAASTLARDGRTLLEIAEILGHRSLQSTKRYAHLSTAHKARVLNETMNKALSGIL
ncbi:MAG: site-specific integrase [Methylophaga sp.]|nr:site-specific integrase [Methylophaga sp.]